MQSGMTQTNGSPEFPGRFGLTHFGLKSLRLTMRFFEDLLRIGALNMFNISIRHISGVEEINIL